VDPLAKLGDATGESGLLRAKTSSHARLLRYQAGISPDGGLLGEVQVSGVASENGLADVVDLVIPSPRSPDKGQIGSVETGATCPVNGRLLMVFSLQRTASNALRHLI
jgi:hypothetical protein